VVDKVVWGSVGYRCNFLGDTCDTLMGHGMLGMQWSLLQYAAFSVQ
jgi:hypothetical protein